MACSDFNSVARQYVSTTAARFCQSVQDGRASVSQDVKIYVEQSTAQHIAEVMTSALSPNFYSYLQHAGDLTCLQYGEVPSLQKALLTRNRLAFLQKEVIVPNQGVYAAVVQSPNGKCPLYIGSSFGRKGLGHRVLHQHLNATYRERYPAKTLYIAMAESEVITSFICLITYAEPVQIGQVLLAEAVCASLFKTFDSDLYCDIRPQDLPHVDTSYGLNRSDPLRSWVIGPRSLGTDLTTFRRLRTLHNCLGSGPMRVCYHVHRERETKTSWRFQLFKLMFTIPKKIAATWNLDTDPVINVEWQCSDQVHPHAFALMAENHEDGSRVGIRAFKIVEGKTKQHWIKRSGKTAVRLANTLHDFLKGQIVGQNYIWKDSREYIFSERGGSRPGIVQKAIKKSKRRSRIGLPYKSENFLWGEKRSPETKPGDVTKALVQEQMNSQCISSKKMPEIWLRDGQRDRIQEQVDFSWTDSEILLWTKSGDGQRSLIQKQIEIIQYSSIGQEVKFKPCVWLYEDWAAEMHEKNLEPYHQDLSNAGHRTYYGD